MILHQFCATSVTQELALKGEIGSKALQLRHSLVPASGSSCGLFSVAAGPRAGGLSAGGAGQSWASLRTTARPRTTLAARPSWARCHLTPPAGEHDGCRVSAVYRVHLHRVVPRRHAGDRQWHIGVRKAEISRSSPAQQLGGARVLDATSRRRQRGWRLARVIAAEPPRVQRSTGLQARPLPADCSRSEVCTTAGSRAPVTGRSHGRFRPAVRATQRDQRSDTGTSLTSCPRRAVARAWCGGARVASVQAPGGATQSSAAPGRSETTARHTPHYPKACVLLCSLASGCSGVPN
jgi:hypothetical protein